MVPLCVYCGIILLWLWLFWALLWYNMIMFEKISWDLKIVHKWNSCMSWWVFVEFQSDGWGSLVWEVAGRSRCSLLLFTLLLLKAEPGRLGLGPAPGSRRTKLFPIGSLGVSFSCSSRPSALPYPAEEVDVKFEQLCSAEVNLPAALGGRCGTEERQRGGQDRKDEAVSHFSRFVSLTFCLYNNNLKKRT